MNNEEKLIEKYLGLIIKHFNLTKESVDSLKDKFDIQEQTKSRIAFTKKTETNFSMFTNELKRGAHLAIVEALKKYADSDALERYMDEEGRFVDKCSCKKIIHKSFGYKQIHAGNHDVDMICKKVSANPDIILYHFCDGSYEDFEAKVKRFSLSLDDKDIGKHIRKYVKLYKEGKLKEYYDSLYSSDVLSVLMDAGIVTKDYSLINYMKYKEILR